MNKTERDKQIAEEANTHLLGSHHDPDKGDEHDAFIASTNSKANLEYLVRRAVEIMEGCATLKLPSYEIYFYRYIDRSIAEIAKELEIDI